MLELIFAFTIGTALGVLAGLIPGLHQNNFIPIILGASFLFEPMSAAIILISAAVVNSFVNYIPSILLGAPEDSSALSVLPGHRLLLQGRGYEAIRLTVIGNFLGAVFAVASLPLFTIIVPELYDIVRPNLFWILSFVVVYMIFSEKSFHEVSEVVVNKQYNVFQNKRMYELPAGYIDEKKTALAIAKKELREETGYVAKKWIRLGEFFVERWSTNKMSMFLALDAAYAGEQQLEDSEDIIVECVPLKKFKNSS